MSNSGIVQSVEQRTVNPYVAGSSPAARAKNSKPSHRGGFLLFYIPITITILIKA